jgi:hypothetical protein
MALHPSGEIVDLVGVGSSDRGRNCEEHLCCGAVLDLDVVLRFRSVQISVEGKEQTALAVYWVSDGIDRCRVGFLRRHLIKRKAYYDGKLAQVVELVGDSGNTEEREKHWHFVGMCRASLIDAELAIPRSASKKKKKRAATKRDDTDDEDEEPASKVVKIK